MNKLNDLLKSMEKYLEKKNCAKEEFDQTLIGVKISKEIKTILAEVACIDAWFEMEEDEDLLESCIYYRESLVARYRHLLKKAKKDLIPSPDLVSA